MKTKTALLLTLIGILTPHLARSADRVALVIGNGAYENIGALDNPVNDATAVGEALEKVGFHVIPAHNLTESQMKAALRDFVREAAGAKAAWIYFAGHGVQLDGENYLIPVDAELEERFEVASETIELSRVLGALEQTSTPLKVVILDCCRDSPFTKSWSRSITRGLSKVDVDAEGTIIAFAAGDDEVALDGDGDNSPYTKALVESILTPGLDVKDVFDMTRRKVWERTGKQQRPWIYEDFIGSFVLNPEDNAVTDDPAKPTKPAMTVKVGAPGPDPAPAVAKADAPNPAEEKPVAKADTPKPAEKDTAPAQPKLEDLPKPRNGRHYNTIDEVLRFGPYEDVDNGTKIRIVSQAQTKLGVRDNDGWMNQETHDALVAFQEENGLARTGLLDTATSEKLALDPGAASTAHASAPAPKKSSSSPPKTSSQSRSQPVANRSSSSNRTAQTSSPQTQQNKPGLPTLPTPFQMQPGMQPPPGFPVMPQPGAGNNTSTQSSGNTATPRRRMHSSGSPGRAPVGRPRGGPTKSSSSSSGPTPPKPFNPFKKKQ